jgi:hypothetical protein
VLNGLRAEDMPEYAALALEQGYDGTRLRQLAGLVRPTFRELENLPERAFADMGLLPMNQDQAVDFLITRGLAPASALTSVLVKEFPGFTGRWRKHVASWGGEPGGGYIEMSEFVHFVVEELYDKGNRDETQRVFELMEQHLASADEETAGLIVVGFFETLQCFASWQPYGNKVFEEFLGPKSAEAWREIQRWWAGKSSLMDVIRAEREQGK